VSPSLDDAGRGSLLYRLVRPGLFALPPETAHHLAVKALRYGAAPLRPFLRPCLRVDDPSLRTAWGGLSFPNPVGLAAGFDKDAEALHGLDALGFGFLEAGTLTPRPQPGNPGPRLFRVPSEEALVNRLGFNNRGAVDAASRLARRGRPSTPTGFNLGKQRDTPPERAAEDYAAGLEALFPWADFFVVNVSSPNTPGLRDLQSPAALEPLLRAVSAKAAELTARTGRKPLLWVKISPDGEADESAVEAAVRAGFHGLVATNTTKNAALPFRAEGGVSGRPLRDLSTQWVRRMYRAAQGRLCIVGVGGIFSARDAYDKILAGASLVELYTGLVYRGWTLPRDVNRGLAELLRRDGFASVQEAVGKGT
jgi:dihydroorotate dehydrogenase